MGIARTAAVAAAALIAPASAFNVPSAGRPSRHVCATSNLMPARTAQLSPLFNRGAAVVMQDKQMDSSSQSFYDEYVQTDPVTGERTAIALDEKEKLYLECLDAFYNENGKQLLGDEEYDQLKLDLDFEGAKIATFSKDEIQFVLANKRYKMGKPVLSDSDYDALRARLKAAGSTVVIHEGAKCDIDGQCKSDLAIDAGKTRLLYLPGTLGGLLLVQEAFFWTVGLDPIISSILGLIPAYFFGIWFTENIFAQKPLVTQSSCPNCGYLQNVFFGDLFNVATDGLVPNALTIDEVECKCPNCKIDVSRPLPRTTPLPPGCQAAVRTS